eukprot:8738093-Lingulodinium_polyedra.AAC.1
MDHSTPDPKLYNVRSANANAIVVSWRRRRRGLVSPSKVRARAQGAWEFYGKVDWRRLVEARENNPAVGDLRRWAQVAADWAWRAIQIVFA